jgi:hypothetical protein
MAEKIEIDRETSLKKLRIFKDLKVQQEYEKALDNSVKIDGQRTVKVITEEQSSKLRRAQELAGQYFNKNMAQEAAYNND